MSKLSEETIRLVSLDDDPICNEILEAMIRLSEVSIEVVTFTSPETCLSYVENNQVDAILTDVSMPGMNGWQFIQKLPKSCQALIFVCSAVFLPSDHQLRAKLDRPIELVEKPITPQKLELIRQLVEEEVSPSQVI